MDNCKNSNKQLHPNKHTYTVGCVFTGLARGVSPGSGCCSSHTRLHFATSPQSVWHIETVRCCCPQARLCSLQIASAVKPENILLFPCAHERYHKEGTLTDASVNPERAKSEVIALANGLHNEESREPVRQECSERTARSSVSSACGSTAAMRTSTTIHHTSKVGPAAQAGPRWQAGAALHKYTACARFDHTCSITECTRLAELHNQVV